MTDPGPLPPSEHPTLAPHVAAGPTGPTGSTGPGRGRTSLLVGLALLVVVLLAGAAVVVSRRSADVETAADLPAATGKAGGGSRGTKPGGELIELDDLIPGSRGTIVLEDGSVIEDPNPASTTTTATTVPGVPPVTNGGANGGLGVAGGPGGAPGGGTPGGQNPGEGPGQVPGQPAPTTAPPATAPEQTVTVPDTTPVDTTPDDTVSSPPNTLGPPPSTPKVTLGPGVTFKFHPQINSFSGPKSGGCTLAASKFVTSVKLSWDTSFAAAVTLYIDKTEYATYSGAQVDATVAVPFGSVSYTHLTLPTILRV